MNSLKKTNNFLLQILAVSVLFFLCIACNKSKVDHQKNAEVTPSNLSENSDSTVVFSRAGQGQVTIDNKYCKHLDEPTRAILFYYASKFNTGFDNAGNPLLAAALESGGKKTDGKKLIDKWFKGNDLAKLKEANVSAVLPDGASNSTWFTFISVVKDKDVRRVYFRTLDTENEEKYREATDLFRISGNHIEVIKIHDFGDLQKK
ncbi:hypothetical protein [Chryseobacterium sp.]|uniref:hypothetical protein n=1 Tax=Chryseobacterium sp. TaxID=1871047 RepID=UPI002603B9C6|nr:hypothetical protein [Chryseobacterium sp.]